MAREVNRLPFSHSIHNPIQLQISIPHPIYRSSPPPSIANFVFSSFYLFVVCFAASSSVGSCGFTAPVMLGMDKIRSAKGKKEKLLVGYFSALCAVLPDLTKLAYEILTNIGFEVGKVTVSKCHVYSGKKFHVYNRKKVCCFDKIIEELSFAQLVYLPFARNFKVIKNFWSIVARNVGIPLPIHVVRGSDVKTLHSALMVSGLFEQLRTEVYSAHQAFAALTHTPFGLIFNEASKCINVEVKHSSSESITYDLNS